LNRKTVSEEYNTKFEQKATTRTSKAETWGGGKSQLRKNFRRYRADTKLLWNWKDLDCLGNRTKKRARVLQRGGSTIQKSTYLEEQIEPVWLHVLQFQAQS